MKTSTLLKPSNPSLVSLLLILFVTSHLLLFFTLPQLTLSFVSFPLISSLFTSLLPHLHFTPPLPIFLSLCASSYFLLRKLCWHLMAHKENSGGKNSYLKPWTLYRSLNVGIWGFLIPNCILGCLEVSMWFGYKILLLLFTNILLSQILNE